MHSTLVMKTLDKSYRQLFCFSQLNTGEKCHQCTQKSPKWSHSVTGPHWQDHKSAGLLNVQQQRRLTIARADNCMARKVKRRGTPTEQKKEKPHRRQTNWRFLTRSLPRKCSCQQVTICVWMYERYAREDNKRTEKCVKNEMLVC